MRTQITVLFTAALPFALIACSSPGDGGGGPTTGCTSAQVTMATQPTACMGTNIVASPANNYAFTSTMRLPPVTVKSMTNLTFDWTAVTKDFLGHPLSTTADLNTVALLLFHLPIAELESKLNADTLSQQDVEIVP